MKWERLILQRLFCLNQNSSFLCKPASLASCIFLGACSQCGCSWRWDESVSSCGPQRNYWVCCERRAESPDDPDFLGWCWSGCGAPPGSTRQKSELWTPGPLQPVLSFSYETAWLCKRRKNTLSCVFANLGGRVLILLCEMSSDCKLVKLEIAMGTDSNRLYAKFSPWNVRKPDPESFLRFRRPRLLNFFSEYVSWEGLNTNLEVGHSLNIRW